MVYYDTGAADTWSAWTTTSSTSTARTYTTDNVWYAWSDSKITATATATTTTTNDTWVTWTTDSTTGRGVRNVQIRQVAPPHFYRPGAEQRAEDRARAARIAVAREEKARKQAEADARANELLMDNLTEQQKEDVVRDGFFFVPSKRPDRQYRIRKGRVGNVDVMEKGRVLHRLCAHPDVQCPDDDTRLAQKLMLEHMEDAFIGRANVHPARH